MRAKSDCASKVKQETAHGSSRFGHMQSAKSRKSRVSKRYNAVQTCHSACAHLAIECGVMASSVGIKSGDFLRRNNARADSFSGVIVRGRFMCTRTQLDGES